MEDSRKIFNYVKDSGHYSQNPVLAQNKAGNTCLDSRKSRDILQNMNFSRCYRNRGKFIYGFDPNIIIIRKHNLLIRKTDMKNNLVTKLNYFCVRYIQRIFWVIFRILAPSIVFFLFLSMQGVKGAIFASCIVEMMIIVYELARDKKMTNSSVIGAIALLFQIISSFLAGYEKLYYVPAFIQNCVVMVLVSTMCIKRKSVFLYIVKDFKFALFDSISDQDVMPLNYIWIGYCLLKILSKVIGLITLDFVALYWIVFALGDPLNILLLVISYIYVKRKVQKN